MRFKKHFLLQESADSSNLSKEEPVIITESQFEEYFLKNLSQAIKMNISEHYTEYYRYRDDSRGISIDQSDVTNHLINNIIKDKTLRGNKLTLGYSLSKRSKNVWLLNEAEMSYINRTDILDKIPTRLKRIVLPGQVKNINKVVFFFKRVNFEYNTAPDTVDDVLRILKGRFKGAKIVEHFSNYRGKYSYYPELTFDKRPSEFKDVYGDKISLTYYKKNEDSNTYVLRFAYGEYRDEGNSSKQISLNFIPNIHHTIDVKLEKGFHAGVDKIEVELIFPKTALPKPSNLQSEDKMKEELTRIVKSKFGNISRSGVSRGVMYFDVNSKYPIGGINRSEQDYLAFFYEPKDLTKKVWQLVNIFRENDYEEERSGDINISNARSEDKQIVLSEGCKTDIHGVKINFFW